MLRLGSGSGLLGLALAGGLCACKPAAERNFLALSELCNTYSQDVCAARDSCCQGDAAAASAADCMEDVHDTCEQERELLTAEAALTYDARHALKVSEQMRDDLATCAAPYLLSRFFEGSLAKGKACKRDAQCASLACEAAEDGEKVCVGTHAAPLCDPTDS
jgi:hypothetical protein